MLSKKLSQPLNKCAPWLNKLHGGSSEYSELPTKQDKKLSEDSSVSVRRWILAVLTDIRPHTETYKRPDLGAYQDNFMAWTGLTQTWERLFHYSNKKIILYMKDEDITDRQRKYAVALEMKDWNGWMSVVSVMMIKKGQPNYGSAMKVTYNWMWTLEYTDSTWWNIDWNWMKANQDISPKILVHW